MNGPAVRVMPDRGRRKDPMDRNPAGRNISLVRNCRYSTFHGLAARLCGVVLTASAFAASATEPADVVLLHGKVHTVDQNRPRAEAIAIRGDRIIAVGSNAEISKSRGKSTTVIDLEGRFVMPGFTDSHVHFMSGSRYLSNIPLRDATTMAEVQRRVAAFAKANPEAEWILGEAWSYGYPDLPNSEFQKEMLDSVVPDRPVFLSSGMAHASWANSKALELAGISEDTPDPPGGEIVRGADGEPTGWLKEKASQLVRAVVPPPTYEQEMEWLRTGILEASRFGVTRIVSAGGDLPHVEQLEEIRKDGGLAVRFSLTARASPPNGIQGDELVELERLRDKYADDYISVNSVKFVADGVVESHTAYLPDGYADQPEETGTRFWDPERYYNAVRNLHERDFQTFTHAIGDGAMRMVFDAVERAQAADAANGHSPRDLRHRIEHAEAPYPSDIKRYRELGMIASMQPLMIYPRDEWKGMEGLWIQYAGEKYLPVYFAIRSVLDAGGVVAFGTDWPVVQLNPLLGLRNAVLRQSLDGQPEGGYVPEQRISIEQAIRAYTLDASYAIHREEVEGSLTPGKLADLVVLSDNLLEIDPRRIHQVEVELTMVGGDIVYQSPTISARLQ